MSEKDIFDKLMCLPGLRRFYGLYAKYKSILLYIFFGGCTTAVSIGSFMLLHTVLGMNELLANIGSWILAVGFAYVTNRVWVFASRVRGKAVWKELLSFYSGRLITLGLEEAMLLVFVTLLHMNGTVIKVIAQIVVLIGNYLISKLITFRKSAA